MSEIIAEIEGLGGASLRLVKVDELNMVFEALNRVTGVWVPVNVGGEWDRDKIGGFGKEISRWADRG